MKKLFTLAVVAILSSIFFSSCGSGLSITKRRYTKGYYVNKTPKPSETKESVASKSSKEVSPPAIIQVMPEIKKENEKQTARKQELENKTIGLAIGGAKKEAGATHVSKKQQVKDVFSDFSIKPFKTIDKAIENHKLSAGSDDDGLSLFWIVILVLLILWALGFISGNFGGIINILLIIALILLILWLLKVL